MNWHAILLAAAVILFILSALGVRSERVSLVAVGFACFAGAFLVNAV